MSAYIFGPISGSLVSFNENSCPSKLIYGQNSWVKLLNTYPTNKYGQYQVSSNRTNWELKNLPNTIGEYHLNDIDYGNNLWIISANKKNQEGFPTGFLTGHSTLLTNTDILSSTPWTVKGIKLSNTNTLLNTGYAWTRLKYGNNTWVLAGKQTIKQFNIDQYIEYIYQLLYARSPTISESTAHKNNLQNILGNNYIFNSTAKAKLIMDIIGFSSTTNLINNRTRNYHTHSSPIIRTFERFRQYGIPSLTKQKYSVNIS